MDRLTIEAAVEKFLANGGEIVSIPEVVEMNPNEVARKLIENSVVNSERTVGTVEGRGYEEVAVAHENWLTF
jgi:hypothetical protein